MSIQFRRWAALLAACLAVVRAPSAEALGRPSYISPSPVGGGVAIVENRRAAPIVVDSGDWAGVRRAARDLSADIARVTGITPAVIAGARPAPQTLIIAGTIGRSPIVDGLVQSKKLDGAALAGKWEAFVVQTVENPMPGVASALVIAGSDKRGTIYGIYDVSEQIGVSPWYWWAEVTPEHKDALFMKPGVYAHGEPSVKYRGIFLNDERPDLDYWVRAKFGERPTPGGGTGTVANFNSQFYARLFEVLLRLKANYLWPAMWNNAFAEDDPDNARLADEYGIVMGSSHQEPMLRAQKEWDWHLRPEHGRWNYAAHPDVLNTFWKDGITARKNYESIYTIGLRGEDDTAMVQGAAESMALLERIVAEQRKMLAEVINPDVTEVPQLWCLYKEVQGYYENGLRVPDDVTLLWAEDNWGNVRRLPTAEERKRSGGAGVYYHFDYHGGPRSYQWLNTNPIAKIWDQMSLAKQYGADRIWIVNVGHFKGYELPTEYFLDLAWDTTRWTGDNIRGYMREWAAREFGERFADDTAEILSKYTMFNGRRKHELLEASTYSVVNFGEADRVVSEYNALTAKAQALFDRLPKDKQDAFYELVLFPTKASANLNEMYVAAAKNALYAAQGRASTNAMAARVRELFQVDRDLATHFNKTLAGGKWDHFMDQVHIGYTSWNEPPQDNLNAVKLTELTIPAAAAMGVAVEGSTSAWFPGSTATGVPALPLFDALNRQRSYIDVFNRGAEPFAFTATASAPWITVSTSRGTVDTDTRVWVDVDWSRAPAGDATGTVTVSGTGRDVTVGVTARTPAAVTRTTLDGFVETAGYVSIEAEHFTKKTDAGDSRWMRIEDFGHTLSGMRATTPVDAAPLTPGSGAPSLDYRMYLFTPGAAAVKLTVAPTLNFQPNRPLRVAVSIDDEAPQVVTLVPANFSANNGNREWEASVRNNARFSTTSHPIAAAGYHTLKIWMVDPAVVVQKIVVDTPESVKAPSYLGPPESYRH